MNLHEIVVNKGYGDINPVQFGYEKCESSHSFGPAIRTHWLLHYVVSGSGYFKIKNREYYVTGGSMFVIPPFVETYYEADKCDPWEYIWVGFTKSESIDLEFEDVAYMPYARSVFENMKKCSGMQSGRTEFLCGNIWNLISLNYDLKSKSIDYIDNALNIIESEYMSPLKIEKISERLGLERTYFSNLFKISVGVSPKHFLLKTRMEKAAMFLSEYKYTVSLTAVSVGYGDVYAFSKSFKQYFGVSPSKYK